MRKLAILGSAAALMGFASAACPYQFMKRAGFLDEETLAKFDEYKRDPKFAESIEEETHSKQQKRSDTLIGPRSDDGLLDLPLGGGLCKHQNTLGAGLTANWLPNQ